VTSRSIGRAAPAAALLVLAGCGSYPLQKIYVLGDPGPPTAGVQRAQGSDGPQTRTQTPPVIELRPVQVPDELDSTDIVRRVGANQVVPSRTGRWGERLSVGITQDLVAGLSRRLPGVTIQARGGYEPSRRLLVTIERFEITPDGRCAVTARWRLSSADGKLGAPSDSGTFIQTAASGTDAAAAAAMTAALDDLAGQIAVTVRQIPAYQS
jgi:uncharacterized lipoprotein YmbA